jgi:hypothetical protein
MANAISSVADRRRKSEVSDEEIEAATVAYLADESANRFAFKSGHTIDVAKAIEMHPQAKALLADEKTASALRRTRVRTAVILGFPVHGSAKSQMTPHASTASSRASATSFRAST